MTDILNAKQLNIKNKKGDPTHTLDSKNIVIFHPNFMGSAEFLKKNDIRRSDNDILILKEDKISKLQLGTQGQVLTVNGTETIWKDVSANTVGNLTANKIMISDDNGNLRASDVASSKLNLLNNINLLDPSTDTESVTLTDNDGFILHDKGTPNQVKIAKLSDLKTYTKNNLTFSAVTENNSNPSSSSQIKTYVDGQITTVNSSISVKQDSLTFGLSATNSLKVQTALGENDILIGGSSNVVPLVLPKGSILVGDGSSKPQKLTIGDNDKVLMADSNNDLGVKWATVSGGGGGGGDSSNGMFTTNTIEIANTSSEGANITFSKGVVYFNITDTGNTHSRVVQTGSDGHVVHIMFDTGSSNGSLLKLDFGTSKLGIGSGTAKYMTFSQAGQSASIVYVGNKWRVLNTGAMVGDS